MNTTYSDVELGVYPEKAPNTKVATLGRDNFALFFGNIEQFRKIYCDLPYCDFIFKLVNNGSLDADVTIVYVYDSIVLRFKVG